MNVFILSAAPAHRKTSTRVEGLVASGAKVTVVGYQRDVIADSAPLPYKIVTLGAAGDRKLLGRMLGFPKFVRTALGATKDLKTYDLMWVNTLDMLLLALLIRPFMRGRPRIVYDVADLTSWQLTKGLLATVVRFVEKHACRRIAALIVTSPWFYWRYYQAFLKPSVQVMLLENKASPPAPPLQPSPPAPPWRIVWNGLLRCGQSLEIITETARALPELVDVHVWGAVANELVEPFRHADQTLQNFHVHGTYSDTHIDPVFEGAHFIFAFDLDDGENSRLLLPNRLYHGAARALPLISVQDSAVGRTTAALKLGQPMGAPHVENLIQFFRGLTPESYEALRRAVPAERRANAVYADDVARLARDVMSGSRAHCVPTTENPDIVLAV